MKLFLDKQLNTYDKETALLAILNGMYSRKYDHLSTSISLIGYEMTGKFLKTSNKRERNIIGGIKDAIRSLAKNGNIEIINQDNDNYILSGKGLDVKTDKKKFVVLEQWEMQSIFERANKPFIKRGIRNAEKNEDSKSWDAFMDRNRRLLDKGIEAVKREQNKTYFS